MRMHDDQVDVTADVARHLIAEQLPQWRGLPVTRVASAGTVNAIFRVGERVAARFPLRAEGPDEARAWLESEAAAAAELAASVTVPAPVPLAIGSPGHGYPLPWSVQTWLEGTVATDDDPSASVPFAEDLATLVRDLRAVSTRGRRFSGRGRGGDLRSHDAWVETCLRRSDGLVDVPRLRRLWDRLRLLPVVASDAMCHGDLIPGNVLVRDGRLVGVLDGGGFGPADPALDLVGAWHLLDAGPRDVLREALGCSAVEWERGRAWALEQSLGLAWYYRASNPTMSALGVRSLRRILDAED